MDPDFLLTVAEMVVARADELVSSRSFSGDRARQSFRHQMELYASVARIEDATKSLPESAREEIRGIFASGIIATHELSAMTGGCDAKVTQAEHARKVKEGKTAERLDCLDIAILTAAKGEPLLKGKAFARSIISIVHMLLAEEYAVPREHRTPGLATITRRIKILVENNERYRDMLKACHARGIYF